MKWKKREIRIKSFQRQSFEALINQINKWLETKQNNNSEVFDLINIEYHSEHYGMPDQELQFTAIAIYSDSIENLKKEIEEKEQTSSSDDEDFISQKKKLEYRK